MKEPVSGGAPAPPFFRGASPRGLERYPVSLDTRMGPVAAAASPPSGLRRWRPLHKLEVVLRLLRGQSLDAQARETGKPASELASWRDEFLQGGEAALKARTKAEPNSVGDAERQRLQAKPLPSPR